MKQFIILLSVLLANTIAYGQGEIKFEKTTINIGEIKPDEIAKVEFEFSNVGNEPITILNVVSTFSNAGINYPKTSIAPGKGGKICLQWYPAMLKTIKKSVTVRSTGKIELTRLRVEGTVKDETDNTVNNTTNEDIINTDGSSEAKALHFDLLYYDDNGKKTPYCSMENSVAGFSGKSHSKLTGAEINGSKYNIVLYKRSDGYGLSLYIIGNPTINDSDFKTTSRITTGTVTLSNGYRYNHNISLSLQGFLLYPNFLLKISDQEIEEWKKYDIAKIEYEGRTIELGKEVITAPTIKAMVDTMSDK